LRNLNDILQGLKLIEVKGNTQKDIAKLELDSRAIELNSMFIAAKGFASDGHDYIAKAIEKGATAVLCESFPTDLHRNVTYVKVENSSRTLAYLASNFYYNPSDKLKLVAVTGTNGKTSIATMLFQLFQQMGYVCGLLSTVENKVGDDVIPSTHTTPHAIAINELLARMVTAGCTFCIMEASSHALVQNRMAGLDIDGAVFSNLTHDHLDYHKTFKDYLKAKKILFDDLSNKAFALSNADDKNGLIMLQNSKARKFLYAITGKADFSGRVLESDFNGMMMSINNKEIHVKMIGGFNAYNVLAVFGAAMLLEQNETEVLIALSTIQGAEGRFEYIVSENDKLVGIVDYAHTPDALKKVLETINQLNPQSNSIIAVVGCGGDRDKTKRPLMGAIAAKLSTKVILTSDNPRTEDPNTILEEMQAGIGIIERKKVVVIESRKQAIKTAVMLAKEGDIILVAGKGHENYQDIMGVKNHFDDKEELEENFKEMGR
jgi:UDP-N-acetylmuramoyl-L-alanyl-D-glutamate--2,6-diaminopimelate ligase